MLTAWAEEAPPRSHFVMATYGVMEPLTLYRTCKHGCCVDDGICGPMALPRYWRNATPEEIKAWPHGVAVTIEVPDLPREKRELIEAIVAAPTARAMRKVIENKLSDLDARGVKTPRMAWRCVTCSTVAEGFLTDETRCKCRDIYDSQWVKVGGPNDPAGLKGGA